MLQTLDFENLAALGMGTSYTFQVEAVDQGGVMPPGQATVTVRITVGPTAPPTELRIIIGRLSVHGSDAWTMTHLPARLCCVASGGEAVVKHLAADWLCPTTGSISTMRVFPPSLRRRG